MAEIILYFGKLPAQLPFTLGPVTAEAAEHRMVHLVTGVLGEFHVQSFHRLRDLVRLGIFEIVPASDGTTYKEYALTDKGRGLFNVVVGLRQWGERFLYKRGEPHSVMIDAHHGKRVGKLELRAHDGRLLGPSDTIVKKV